jgi:hypothetical protein
MSCEICGRSSCTRCFHSLSEQEEFDTKTGRYAPKEDTPQEKPLKNERRKALSISAFIDEMSAKGLKIVKVEVL